MPARRSAGLLVHRGATAAAAEVLLGHLGGPYWQRREAGAWSIPKGEYTDGEEPLAAAYREFAEETGLPAPDGPVVELGSVTQAGGKVVTVWAVRGDVDAAAAVSNTFELEWPPRSGRLQSFPELDRLAWLRLEAARPLLVAAQATFLDRLAATLPATPSP